MLVAVSRDLIKRGAVKTTVWGHIRAFGAWAVFVASVAALFAIYLDPMSWPGHTEKDPVDPELAQLVVVSGYLG